MSDDVKVAPERRLTVAFPYRGGVVVAQVEHEVTWELEDEVDDALPLPVPGKGKDGTVDMGDFTFLRQHRAVSERRELRTIALAMGSAFCGGHGDIAAREEYLRRKYNRATIQHIAKNLSQPTEATEEEIAAEMQRLYPTLRLRLMWKERD